MNAMPTFSVASMTADDMRSHGLDPADYPETHIFHLVTWANEMSGWIVDTGDGNWWTMAFNDDEIFQERDACIAWLYRQLVA